ncbi:RAD protein [Plasmodium cynomolgi strain B]|uniref:RAD protein n=1 Tax=Plasmodium cynomolgi (strain B) TaxID=1120755 RepID=K6UD57_PLACD|nr:RAD protein [Plasmodium cynomolgi strain B]GAB66021.1 RAD protein [Plasmodium cynomolgi strain B]
MKKKKRKKKRKKRRKKKRKKRRKRKRKKKNYLKDKARNITIPEELFNTEIPKLVKNFRLIVNETRLNKTFNRYCNYLNVQYAQMIDKLKTDFFAAAAECGMKDRDKEKYWKECENSLISDFKTINEIHTKHTDTYVEKVEDPKKINHAVISHYGSWLWNKKLKEEEKNGAKFFEDKIKKHRRG